MNTLYFIVFQGCICLLAPDITEDLMALTLVSKDGKDGGHYHDRVLSLKKHVSGDVVSWLVLMVSCVTFLTAHSTTYTTRLKLPQAAHFRLYSEDSGIALRLGESEPFVVKIWLISPAIFPSRHNLPWPL
jgi:hypothetical protein